MPSTLEPSADLTKPSRQTEARLVNVDGLRAVALLLILIVNIAYFASGYPFHLVADPAHDSWLDHTVVSLVELFFAMKAYLIFSFLFGYSFTLQLDSAARRGVDIVRRFRRRLAGLFVLGVLHAVLLFQGDILTTYALLGLVLLAMRNARVSTALRVAVLLTGGIGFVLALAAAGGAQLASDPAEALAAGQRSTEALQGGLGSLIVEHVRQLPAMYGALLVQGPLALSAFLFGYAAGRRRLLADPDGNRDLLRRVQKVGYPVGLAGAVVFTVGGGTANLTGLAAGVLTAPLLAAAYAATVIRFFQTDRGRRVAAVLAPAGRMSLSNYLGQSLLCVLVFTGVGMGLAGTVPPLVVLLIALTIYGVQVVVSMAWMSRFRYGPMEWLLRAWTEQRWPRLR
ncbi:DUF418 domain-containing protein [Micromonospora sp. HM5-17]|jgi:uncharacterized protein|uniref:DUF418 domain-containing protein n=1 Tax=Micromonospora sp. HM5-17 TaxID=2487710 RepID=UPI000F49C4E0|nr:DUF418 domain-containing protein [Micromonospora sp. HM5-17]ROT33963.1 DUF418 domain-containing protein [Micromonospora sp. HM5-17]